MPTRMAQPLPSPRLIRSIAASSTPSVPIDSSDGDCKARAVRHAMADAPIGDAADADYHGY